ncbi:lipopolysaccharide biosynthesis protein [Sphaerisporangium fuscum]|uniref:lipopolysaccharide biosynthesis protein n=1 Tax=Sphaerisporangium fuscum TaxID=2835868 RepID=UPI001BDC9A91|nr:oligosaccharide flippase family protein [Sphaerisporangium fuscum]
MSTTVAGGPDRHDPGKSAGRVAVLWRRLLTDLRNPLFLNGYALMANTGITAVLGMGYWLLAARLYSPADFGRSQALITAMRLFAGLTALGLTGALARFIPVAGRRTGEFIRRGYLIATLTAVVAAAGFLLTLPVWGENYSTLAGLGPGLFFLASVAIWSVFTLQDVALAGMRKAVWVPVNSLCFGLVKMGLLVAVAGALPDDGIYVSWIVPTAVALIPISIFIFGVLVPRHARQAPTGSRPPRLREIGRFLAGDYPGAFSVLAIVYFLPVYVASKVSGEMFGYFSMPQTLGAMIELLAINMATSLTVEGSSDRTRLAANCRQALRRAYLIIGPVVAVTILAAPPILSVFGPAFAEHGTPLLRLMALAVLPRVLIEIYLSALRARSQARTLALVQIGLAVLVLSSSVILLPITGITAVGYGLLFSETLVALLIFGGLRKILNAGETPQAAGAREGSEAASWST